MNEQASQARDRLARGYARRTEDPDRGPTREVRAALDELAARLDAEAPPA